MTRTNPVNSVLVTYGNQAPLAAGSYSPAALAPGQIGFFSRKLNLSIDQTSPIIDFEEFYIATGIDPQVTGATTDARRSAGLFIKGSQIQNVSARCYSPGQNKIMAITNFTASCNTEYGIKLGVKNQEVWFSYGYNYPYKEYHVITSGCPSDCTGGACDSSGNELALLMVNEINLDPSKVFTANMVDYTTVPGTYTVVPPAGWAAWVIANPGKVLGIEVIGNPEALRAELPVNLKYDSPRQTDFNIVLTTGFKVQVNNTLAVIPGVPVIVTVQDLFYEQGAGYDVEHWENVALGQIGGLPNLAGVYRTSELTGVGFSGYLVATATTNYYLWIISYAASKETDGNESVRTNTGLCTIVAIPCPDTTTRTAFMLIADRATATFATPLSAYNTNCPACTVVADTATLSQGLLNGRDGEGNV